MQFYNPNWKRNVHSCYRCKWRGEAIGAVLGRTYGQILEIVCPQCDKHIGLELVGKVHKYFRKQEDIILDIEPACDGISLKESQKFEEWEKFVIDFEESAERLNQKLFKKAFNVDLIQSGVRALRWSVIGKSVGLLRAVVSHQGQAIAVFRMKFGDSDSFLIAASQLYYLGIRDIVPTEMAFSAMCGENKFAYRKINMARIALQYALD